MNELSYTQSVSTPVSKEWQMRQKEIKIGISIFSLVFQILSCSKPCSAKMKGIFVVYKQQL